MNQTAAGPNIISLSEPAGLMRLIEEPNPRKIRRIQLEIGDKIGLSVRNETARLLAMVLQLMEEYSSKITIRQLYYQLLSRGVIKENSKRSYENTVHLLTTGRKSGVIRWDAFEDRIRMFYRAPVPQYNIALEVDAHDALVDWFRYALNPDVSKEYDIAKWEDQPYYVELWVEKDALAGFLSPLCESLGVGLVVSRGYTSYTFKQEALRRFRKVRDEEERVPVLLYLGDLDPSGYNIYQVLEEEMASVATLERLGLDPEDVTRFRIYPCPDKEKDTRKKEFQERFPGLNGNGYELDGLPPAELMDRAREGILRYFDEGISADNQQTIRHFRANFTDEQDKVKDILAASGIDLA